MVKRSQEATQLWVPLGIWNSERSLETGTRLFKDDEGKTGTKRLEYLSTGQGGDTERSIFCQKWCPLGRRRRQRRRDGDLGPRSPLAHMPPACSICPLYMSLWCLVLPEKQRKIQWRTAGRSLDMRTCPSPQVTQVRLSSSNEKTYSQCWTPF